MRIIYILFDLIVGGFFFCISYYMYHFYCEMKNIDFHMEKRGPISAAVFQWAWLKPRLLKFDWTSRRNINNHNSILMKVFSGNASVHRFIWTFEHFNILFNTNYIHKMNLNTNKLRIERFSIEIYQWSIGHRFQAHIQIISGKRTKYRTKSGRVPRRHVFSSIPIPGGLLDFPRSQSTSYPRSCHI